MLTSPKRLRPMTCVITPTSGAPAGGVVAFESFGLKQPGGDTAQAGLQARGLITKGFVFVNVSSQLQRDVGIALGNPNAAAANVTLALNKSDGTPLETKTVDIAAGNQTAKFVSDVFSDQATLFNDFIGTLLVTSDIPIAMVALRFRGVQFSAVPMAELSQEFPVPRMASGAGGPGSVLLPHFAEDGGWSTEVVIVNPGTATLNARVDFVHGTGEPVQVTLNGVTQSTFNVTVPPNGVATLAPRDAATGASRF